MPAESRNGVKSANGTKSANGVTSANGARSANGLGTSTGVKVAGRALVLNATFEPLGVVSTRRALLLVLATKAELVHPTERLFRSERTSFPEPSIVRLARYVRVPHERTVSVNRRTVFARDSHRCQYCGSAAESIDHVVPRSRGGLHSWDNVVAACRRCNTRKEDRLPHEAGLVLRSAPVAPRHRVWLLATGGATPEEWVPYLGEQSLTA
jgi:5-methylcytosine-specific restriction endonuclease McrA